MKRIPTAVRISKYGDWKVDDQSSGFKGEPTLRTIIIKRSMQKAFPDKTYFLFQFLVRI
jgi:hypothetical protein